MTEENQNLNNLSDTEKVDFLFKKYKDKFTNGFLHSLLWALLVNKTRKLTDAAFTPVIQSGYTILGIADKGMKGYTPTMVVFKTHNYDEAQQICTEMNADAFGITEDQADDIVFSTIKM